MDRRRREYQKMGLPVGQRGQVVVEAGQRRDHKRPCQKELRRRGETRVAEWTTVIQIRMPEPESNPVPGTS